MSLLVMGALFYVGIDWAATRHAVCVLDATGRCVAAYSIEHSAAGFTSLVRRLGAGPSIPEPGEPVHHRRRHLFRGRGNTRCRPP